MIQWALAWAIPLPYPPFRPAYIGDLIVAVEHLTDDELERHVMGKIPEGAELERIEEHLLWCQGCIDRSVNIEEYVKTMKAGLKAQRHENN